MNKLTIYIYNERYISKDAERLQEYINDTTAKYVKSTARVEAIGIDTWNSSVEEKEVNATELYEMIIEGYTVLEYCGGGLDEI